MMARARESGVNKFLSGGGLVAVIMFLVGQATFSIVYQIINNEQQQAAIIANQVQLKTLRDEIANMQTPLSSVVLRLEARVVATEIETKRLDSAMMNASTALNARLDGMDRTGTRGLENTTSAVTRLSVAIDRNGDRLAILDKRIGDVENRSVIQLQGQLELIRENIKRIDDQLTRTVQALDATYNSLQDHLRVAHPRGRSEAPISIPSTTGSAYNR